MKKEMNLKAARPAHDEHHPVVSQGLGQMSRRGAFKVATALAGLAVFAPAAQASATQASTTQASTALATNQPECLADLGEW
ncbi:MAG: hypothetical protein ACRCSP_05820 [Rhodoglobus sp.]